MYKRQPESIHLCDFPVANEVYIDAELEKNMDEVLKIVVMGRACPVSYTHLDVYKRQDGGRTEGA